MANNGWGAVGRAIEEAIGEMGSMEHTFVVKWAPGVKASIKWDVDTNAVASAAVENIRQRMIAATPQVAMELGTQLNMNMNAAAWGWRDGKRDIVDTGELRDSMSILTNGLTFEVSYDAPYAALVNYGGYISPYGNLKAPKVYIPGRPWITATMQGGGPVPAFNFYQAYIEKIM